MTSFIETLFNGVVAIAVLVLGTLIIRWINTHLKKSANKDSDNNEETNQKNIDHQARIKDKNLDRNIKINKFISKITDEIERIKIEPYKSEGQTGKIEAIAPQISRLNINIEEDLEFFLTNEKRRKRQQPERKSNAINALQRIIVILEQALTYENNVQ